MKTAGSGVIVNIASDAGLRGEIHPYGISKWGVVGLTKGLGKRCAGDGVRVNAIAPGPVATRMIGWEPGKPTANDRLPLGRFADPEEIASVAVFLASDDSAGMFGQVLPVNSSTAF
jgi:3-oxoacyl-[acyl-carrier protein] reductase